MGRVRARAHACAMAVPPRRGRTRVRAAQATVDGGRCLATADPHARVALDDDNELEHLPLTPLLQLLRHVLAEEDLGEAHLQCQRRAHKCTDRQQAVSTAARGQRGKARQPRRQSIAGMATQAASRAAIASHRNHGGLRQPKKRVEAHRDVRAERAMRVGEAGKGGVSKESEVWGRAGGGESEVWGERGAGGGGRAPAAHLIVRGRQRRLERPHQHDTVLPWVGVRDKRSENAEAMEEVAVDETRREPHARHAHGFEHASRAQLQQHTRPVDLRRLLVACCMLHAPHCCSLRVGRCALDVTCWTLDLQEHTRPVNLPRSLLRVRVDAADVVRRRRVDYKDQLVQLHLELRSERVHEQRRLAPCLLRRLVLVRHERAHEVRLRRREQLDERGLKRVLVLLAEAERGVHDLARVVVDAEGGTARHGPLERRVGHALVAQLG